MSWMRAEERDFAAAIAGLSYCNQFLPERVEHTRRALGPAFVKAYDVWSPLTADGEEDEDPNNALLLEKAEAVLAALARRGGARPDAAERALHADLVHYALYFRHIDGFWELTRACLAGEAPRSCRRLHDRFVAEGKALLEPVGSADPGAELSHLFACFFQLRRAFHLIFRHILGASMPAARLRAAVWQSIFTHDVRRYRRALYPRMGQLTTLITGPSGTGKELVAQAIALSRFVPYDPGQGGFAADLSDAFRPVNLSALSPTLIESELFGHRRGAFTGALEDRPGYLETCGPFGTIFLDEIGELDPAIQVKLLRVLQDRRFQRLGETEPREFAGKVVAATHRDLASEIEAGRFREDFYYRLCSDLITTPSLAEQVADAPDELAGLVELTATRLVGPEEAPALAGQVMLQIERLGPDYPWPGNFRELEQCVRNVLVHGSYRPRTERGPTDGLWAGVEGGELTAEDVLRRYTTLVYARTRNYEETARRLGIDRRTVKRRVDPDWLARL